MNIKDLSEDLMSPAVLTPAQFYGNVTGTHDAPIRPIKRLMLAVLEDGLRCYQTYRAARVGFQRQLFAEAEVWLWDRRADGPFSFQTICDTLGINAECLRSTLRKSESGESNRAAVRRLARRSPVVASRGLSPKLPRRRRKAVWAAR